MTYLGRALLSMTALLMLSGCTMGPNFKLPFLNLPKKFPEQEVAAAPAPLPVPTNWWLLYGDAALTKLVAAGLQDNTDVRIAIARLEEAEAFVREVAAASLLPELDGKAQAERLRSSRLTGTLPLLTPAMRNYFEVSVSTSFELDFWGRLRRTREAARAQYAASAYGRDVVALMLAANIAQTYFNVRSLDAQVVVSEASLRSAIDTLEITRKRAEAGYAPDLDMHQSEANRALLASQLKELQRMRAAAIHQLGLLTGISDLDLARGDVRSLPAPPLPPAGLPSTLLERRPDIRQAAATLEAANAQIGAARAAQFPTISLTGSYGFQSQDLSNLFSHNAAAWNFTGGLTGPILDWGRYAARTAQAEARWKQASASYEKTALTAFREVADALSNVRLAAEAEQDYAARADAAGKSLKLATMRYDSGYSAYLEVLDAQRTLNDAQLALVRNRQQYLGYTVDLMNALGGGWVPR